MRKKREDERRKDKPTYYFKGPESQTVKEGNRGGTAKANLRHAFSGANEVRLSIFSSIHQSTEYQTRAGQAPNCTLYRNQPSTEVGARLGTLCSIPVGSPESPVR